MRNKNIPNRTPTAGSGRYRPVTAALLMLVTMASCAGKPDEELLARSQQALEAGDIRAAVIDAKTVLQDNPDDPRGRRLLGEAYLFQQDPTAAVAEFERALRADGSDPELLILHARSLAAAEQWVELLGFHEQGKFAAVEDDPRFMASLALAMVASDEPAKAQQILERGGDHPSVRLVRAILLLQTEGDLEGANRLLEALVADAPEDAEVWGLLGSVRHLLRDFAEAEEAYTRALALNPFRLADRVNLVMVRLEQNKFDEAEVELEKLEKSIPDQPAVSYARGRILLHRGDETGAAEAFGRVLTANPNHPGALYLGALVNGRLGQFATARSQLTRFLALRPNDVNGRLVLASLHWREGEYEGVVSAATTVLEHDADNETALAYLAGALGALDRHGESIDAYHRLVELAPGKTGARLLLASQQMLAEQPEAAVETLLAAREIAPGDGAVRQKLVEVYLVTGNDAAARAEAQAYVADHPDDVGAILAQAQVALVENNLAEARSGFEKVLQKEPGHVLANQGLALMAMADRNPEQARRHYRDALAHHPQHIGMLTQLAALEKRGGSPEVVSRLLETAVEADATALVPALSLAYLRLQQERHGEAVRLLLSLRKDHPAEPEVWRMLAQAQAEAGNLEGAIDAGNQLLALEADNAAANAMVGKLNLHARRYAESEARLKKALELEQENVLWTKLLAEALLGQSKLEEAEDVLRGLPKDVVAEPEVQVALGRIALGLKRPAEAEAHLRDALAQEPNQMTLLWLGSALSAQQREDEKVKLLEQWLADRPDDLLVRHRLADAHLQSGREAKAREELQKVLEKAPENVAVLNNLAWLHQTENPQRALELIEKAHRLAPNSAQVKDTYAMIQLQRGALAEALSLSEKALELAPDDPQLRFHRARILQAAGDVEGAVAMLESLLGNENFEQMTEVNLVLDRLRNGRQE